MVIDHVGIIFFPHITLLRLIGRLSFPLFAWLIANGAQQTKNINKYLLRLFIFALISQLPYSIFLKAAGFQNGLQLNVCFTLFFGLASISFIKKSTNRLFQICAVVAIAGLAFFLKANYGFVGVISIVCFYIFLSQPKKIFWSQLIIYTTWTIFFSLFFVRSSTENLIFYKNIPLQIVAVLSTLLIVLYNNKQGPKVKYFFYAFYPIHLIILYVIKVTLL
jgi:hypothetical protein